MGWKDVTTLPIEDLDNLAVAGLLWYRWMESDARYMEGGLPSHMLIGTDPWRFNKDRYSVGKNRSYDLQWYIRTEE